MRLGQPAVRLAILGLALATMSVTCGDGTGPPGPVARVLVRPAVDSMLVGDSVFLTVELRDSSDRLVTDRPVLWALSDSSKASLRPEGWVTARTAESFTVTATSEGVVGGAFLAGQYPVASLDLPDSITISRYDTVQVIPDVRSASGTPLSGRATTWTIADTNVLSLLSPSGSIAPRALGVARVVAASFGHADTSVVTVVPESVATITLVVAGADPVPPGSVVPVVASFYDRESRATAGVPLTWTSSDPALAEIAPDSASPNRGLLTARARGEVIVRATGGGASGEVTVAIRALIARMTFAADSFNLYLHYNWLSLVPVTLRDSLGNAVATTDQVTLTTTSPSIVSLTSPGGPGSISAVGPGRARVIGTLANGLADTALIIVPSGASPRLHWSVSPYTYALRSEAGMLLAALDSFANNATLDVTVTSSDTTVLRPRQSFFPAAGGWFGVPFDLKGPGEANVVATSGSIFATLAVTVVDVPVSSVTIAPRFWTMIAGDSLRMSASIRGTDGWVLNTPIAWSSSNEGVATVAGVPGVPDSGVVRAQAGGDVYITAASEGKHDVAHIIISSVDAPVLDSVRPLLLAPGSSGTIYGSGFDTDPGRNTLTLDGVPVVVAAATASTVTFTIPPSTSFPCAATRGGRLVLASGGRVGMTVAPFAAAPQRALLAGQALILTASESQCFELGLGRHYIAVVNPTPNPNAVAAFELRGEAPTWGLSSPPTAPAKPVRSAASGWPLRGSPAESTLARARAGLRLHRRLLEESRRLVLRAGPPAPLLRGRPRGPQLSIADTVGSMARVRVPRIDYPDFCSRYEGVTVRRVYTGARVVIFEDTSAPLAGKNDSGYAAIGREFDDVMYPRLLSTFGDPLALDSLLDNNGRIAMVFTPMVNGWGIGGFVASCDFYPETVAPSSNTGEVLYAPVPESVPAGFPMDAATYWRWYARTIVMHEAKHLTAFAERLKRGASLEEVWLEEGSAVLAEEIWSRGVYGTSWKGDATYRQTLYCDVRPTWPECLGRPLSMFNAFALLYDFASEPSRHSPLGWTSDDDATFYGSAWWLLRWTVDHYATNEGAFLRALTQEPSLTGVANLEAHAGRPFADLVTDWLLASVADNYPGLTTERPQLRQPSWQTRTVFGGMNADFPDNFPLGWPFRFFGYVGPSQDFVQTVTEVHGGSAAFFDVTGYPTELLQLRAIGGGPPDPALRVAILRVF